MDETTLNATINFINNHDISKLMISGGEITEHPRFKEFILRIVKETGCNIFLASNGMFILDQLKTNDILELLKISKILCLQITNIKKYYPRNDFMSIFDSLNIRKIQINDMENFSPVNDVTKKIYIETNENTISLVPLGRAKIDYPGIKNERKPACINLYSRQGLPTLDDIFIALDNSVYNVCKPTITPEGNLLAGESMDCTKIGTIWDSDEKIWNFLDTHMSCNKCHGMENIDRELLGRIFRKPVLHL